MNNYFQGLRALEDGDFPRAIGLFNRALTLDPADADSRVERGFAHLAVGDFDRALEDCQAVLRYDPAHPRGCQLRERLNGRAHALAAQPAENRNPGASESGPAESPLGLLTTVVFETPRVHAAGEEAPSADVPLAEIDSLHEVSAEAAAPPVLAAPVSAPPDPARNQPARNEPDSYELAQEPGREFPGTRPAGVTAPPEALKPEPVSAAPVFAEPVFAGWADLEPAAEPANRDLALELNAPRGSAPVGWGLAAGLASAAAHVAVLLALATIVVHARVRSDDPLVVASSLPANAAGAEPYVLAEGEPSGLAGPLIGVGDALADGGPGSEQLEAPPTIEPQSLGTSQLAVVHRGFGGEITAGMLREYEMRETTELGRLRTWEGRRKAVLERGGTPESEAAVERALQWLVRHQNYDGSWNFDHRACGDCRGRCGSPGTLPNARVGATAMALLPFLGAGHTHLIDKYSDSNKYARQVLAGLRFLVRSQRPDGGMNEPTGRMYDHGLAAIALCEAYGMTLDRSLRKPAERALGFIVAAQDPVGGGWRYQPQMPGDTSVVGWQLMALKSGQMAYLRVPQETIDGANRFLDSVALDEGAGYGYIDTNYGTEATSAVGLLCRMYLGWPRENAALTRGVQACSALEPSTSNMYFNYYATQVLHHYEGPLWEKWNTSMRDYLVRGQSERGHETGSWFFDGDKHNAIGGRLYCTCLAAMTLEVYYRHMPLYKKRAVLDKLGK